MQYTAKSSSQPNPLPNPPAAPRNKRAGGLANLRKALAGVARRADELLEVGYRFERSRTVHARIDVIKPGHTEASYHVDFWNDARTRQLRYRCDCEAFQFAQNAQQWDVHIQPDCKHGRRAMSVVLGALQLAEHIAPLPPALEGQVARAQLDPDGPQPCASFDASNPWPTKRAVAAPPAWDVIARRLLQS